MITRNRIIPRLCTAGLVAQLGVASGLMTAQEPAPNAPPPPAPIAVPAQDVAPVPPPVQPRPSRAPKASKQAAPTDVFIDIDDADFEGADRVREEAERAATELRKTMPRMKQELERAKRDVAKAKAQVNWVSGRPSDRTLVIPAGDLSRDAEREIEQDLRTMARILRKTADKGSRTDPFRIAFMPEFNVPNLDALYIEGHGAVFFLAVDVPLLQARAANGKKADAHGQKDDKDQVWEDTRRSLERSGDEGDVVAEVEDEVEFDTEQVAQLKRRLTASLKHAVNIHALKANETVTIVVFGAGSNLGRRVKLAAPQGQYEVLAMRPGAGGIPGASAVLTLRATKADIDSLAGGKVTIDQMPVRVHIREN